MVNNNNQSDNNEEHAVFNMALATLQDLSSNLAEIRKLSYKVDLPVEVMQVIKIGLVRQFFVRCSPLLPEEDVTKYKKEVLKLKPYRQAKFSSNKYRQETRFLGNKIIYDEQLDERMDEILIELQLILQKQRYFMPTTEDEGDF